MFKNTVNCGVNRCELFFGKMLIENDRTPHLANTL